MEIESVWYAQSSAPSAPLRSVGLHPWHLDQVDLNLAKAWLLEQLQWPGVVALGEAGLDKVTDTPWEIQIAAFQVCIELAQQSGKPLLIHCVRAYGEVLQCLQQAQDSAQKNGPLGPVVFHGFDKHPNTAKAIWSAGYYLSFGEALFKHNSHAAEALRQTPEERFFLETDASAVPIEAIYERAAAIRGLPVAVLGAVIKRNYERVFG